MPVPKRRRSKIARDLRRSHHHLTKFELVKCSHCGEKCLPHRVCLSCGYSGESLVLDFAKRRAKKDKKAQKELAQRKKIEEKEKKEKGKDQKKEDKKPAKVQV